MCRALTLLAFALVCWQPPSDAWAQDGPGTRPPTGCRSAHVAAAARIARRSGTPIELVRCTQMLAVLRLVVPDAGPLDVELRKPAQGAFRRVGELGVSPIVEVADFGDLPEAQRDAFGRLVSDLTSTPADGETLLAAQVQSWLPAPERVRPWPLFFLLGLLALWLAGAARQARRDTRIAWALFALGLALRLALGFWGPLHVNGQGPLWVSGALESWRLSLYGPGYREFFGLSELFARPDRAIWVTNALFGALWAPLMWRLGRLLDLRREAALAASLLLLLDPVGVRIAATESYLIPLVMLLLLTAIAVSHGASKLSRRERGPAAWAWLAAALFTAQIARTHPVAWLPTALLPVLAWAPGARLSRRTLRLGVSAVALACGALLLSGDAVQAGLVEAQRHGSAVSLAPIWANLRAVEWVFVLTLVCVWRGRASRAFWLALLAAAADLLTRRVYNQSPLWVASFDRLYLPWVVLGLAACWPRSLSGRWGRLASVALPLVFALWTLRALGPGLTQRTTEQREDSFLARELSTAPPACWVAWVHEAGPHRRINLPTYAVPMDAEGTRAHALSVQRSGDLSALALRTDCLIYMRSSLCQSAEGGPLCRDVERGARLELLRSTDLPAVPSYEELPYDRSQVEVSVFRVRVR